MLWASLMAIAATPYETFFPVLGLEPRAGSGLYLATVDWKVWVSVPDSEPEHAMIRWLVVVFIVLILLNFFAPFLDKIGYGRLPGDFRFRLFGRPFYLPVATTVLISLVAAALVRIL